MKKQTVMLYLEKDDEMLFLIRNKANDTVHKQGMLLPMGGKVEENESIEEAVIREAKEESGITVHTVDLRAVLYFRNFGTQRHDSIAFLFTSSDFSGEPIPGNEGSFVWEKVKTIANLNLYRQDKVFLDLLLKHQFFVADFLCEGHEMVEYTVLKAL
jgi:8-oxo-dGTP diphosphatase